jgi:hypothetical protein
MAAGHREAARSVLDGGEHGARLKRAGASAEEMTPPRCLVWVATASRGADLVFLGSAESRFSAPA